MPRLGKFTHRSKRSRARCPLRFAARLLKAACLSLYLTYYTITLLTTKRAIKWLRLSDRHSRVSACPLKQPLLLGLLFYRVCRGATILDRTSVRNGRQVKRDAFEATVYAQVNKGSLFDSLSIPRVTASGCCNAGVNAQFWMGRETRENGGARNRWPATRRVAQSRRGV